MTKADQLSKDIRDSEKALRRAAKKAREIAKQKGIYIVIYRNGEIVKVNPNDANE